MQHYKFVILGGGPSGLSFAQSLKQRGVTSFLVVEKESTAGGLCRSVEVDGHPLDMGGGHFLDLKRQEVLDFLFQFMPRDEWTEHSRVSKIRLRGIEIDHPLEANLWQLSAKDQVDFLESIARASCMQGGAIPESFADWVDWKFGSCISGEYMLPYNRKIWSLPLARLGTYWLHKLPNVSFRETLQSCLERRPLGSLPAHGTFLYPKRFGYGEVWRRMAEDLGDHFIPDFKLQSIDSAARVINGNISADVLVTTIPWTIWPAIGNPPVEISSIIRELVHIGIDVDYYPETMLGPSHWIYDPDEQKSYHRILCRSNFCSGARGYWTETNDSRAGPLKHWRHRNEFAYPVNTIGKPAIVARITEWARRHSILPLGRWGTWEHMNSDVAVMQALTAARTILTGSN